MLRPIETEAEFWRAALADYRWRIWEGHTFSGICFQFYLTADGRRVEDAVFRAAARTLRRGGWRRWVPSLDKETRVARRNGYWWPTTDTASRIRWMERPSMM